MGISLKDCKMYTNGTPCMDCARGIIQSGIKEVIVDKSWDDDNTEKWREHAQRTLIMFKEAGVKIRYYTGKILSVHKFRRGKVIN